MSNPNATTWIQALTRFNERNLSRTVNLEIINGEMGVQSEARGVTLHGVAFDRHDGGVEIMLGGKLDHHVTYTLNNVTAIDMLTAEAPATDVLRVVHGAGQTILTASRGMTCGDAIRRCATVPG